MSANDIMFYKLLSTISNTTHPQSESMSVVSCQEIYSLEVKSMDSGARSHRFKCWLCHFSWSQVLKTSVSPSVKL